jgi:hypothetical protein
MPDNESRPHQELKVIEYNPRYFRATEAIVITNQSQPQGLRIRGQPKEVFHGT